jgi:hypothetical protein
MQRPEILLHGRVKLKERLTCSDISQLGKNGGEVSFQPGQRLLRARMIVGKRMGFPPQLDEQETNQIIGLFLP